jgi:hypothetical protein
MVSETLLFAAIYSLPLYSMKRFDSNILLFMYDEFGFQKLEIILKNVQTYPRRYRPSYRLQDENPEQFGGE